MAQRAPVAGKGVPGTACAEDLFSRFDALGGIPGQNANAPTAIAFGFVNGDMAAVQPGKNAADQVRFVNVRANSFVANLVKGLYPARNDPWYTVAVKWSAIAVFLVVLWLKTRLTDSLLSLRAAPEGCDPDALKMLSADIAYKEFVCSLTGGDPEWVTKVDVYARNYLCPTVIMSAGDAVAGYLRNVLTRDEMDDYCTANGLCGSSASVILRNSATLLGAAEYEELYRRKVIDLATWKTRMRELGYLEDQLPDWIDQLRDFYPDAPTTIDWARRKVTDDAHALAYELDEDLGGVQKEQISDWMHRNGLDPEQTKWLLRSQYQAPDVQTALDLYRRDAAGLLPDGITFDETDLDEAIQQSTIAPAYRDTLKALAWIPFNRRQIVQLLEYDAITSDQAKSYLIASGVKETDAVAQLAAWQPVITEFKRKRIGASGVSGYLSMFAAGTLGTTELQGELQALGLSEQEVSDATDEARSQRTRKTRAQLITFLHGRYVKGDVSDAQVQSVLVSTGLDLEDVSNLLRLWRIELEASPKEPSVNELLDWHCRGIMSDAELATRLANLKYSMADIARIVAVGEYKCMTQVQGEAEKLMGRVQKSLSKAQQSWSKTLGQVGRQVGTVQQRTRTNAGKILSAISTELVGAPPPKGSMAANAAAYAAQNAAAAPVVSGAAVAPTSIPVTASTISGASGGTGTGATTAAAVSSPVTADTLAQAASTQNAQEAYITQSLQQPAVPSPASQPAQSEAQGSSQPVAGATASETYPATPPQP